MITCVTSMSEAYYNACGSNFISSFLKYAPRDWRLMVFTEDFESLKTHYIGHDVMLKDLKECEGYTEFLHKAASFEQTMPRDNYRYQASRFCNKVFAVYETFMERYNDTIFWFDADTEFLETPSQEIINKLMPPAFGLSILQRNNWPHSEGGFIAIGINAYGFVSCWRNFYLGGAIFNLREWHDCMAMDTAIKLHNTPTNKLSTNPDVKHVWPESPLGTFSVHYKGPGRKAEKFGNPASNAKVTNETVL